MLGLTLAAAAALGIAAAFLVRGKQRLAIVLTILFVVLTVFPVNSPRGHLAFATGTVVAVALLAFVLLLSGRTRYLPWAYMPFLVWSLLLMCVYWPTDEKNLGNYANLLLAVGAYMIGKWVATQLSLVQDSTRIIAWLFLGLVIAQTLVMVLQTLGVAVFALEGRTAEFEGGRANGTLWHPAVIGKILILLMILILPLTVAADRRTQVLANWGMFLALIPVGLSGSRSNFIAILAVIFVWILLRRRTAGTSGRFWLIVVVGAVALFFLDAIIARFQQDPLGGERGHFQEVALKLISEHFWLGVGPDAYIDRAGEFDALTAAGWPVHNVFLLWLAELGFVGAVLWIAPMVVLLIQALGRVRSAGEGGDFSRAYIAAAPGIILMGVTGWGLAIPSTHFLWFFILGVVAVKIRLPSSKSEPQLPLVPAPKSLPSRRPSRPRR